jgi:hypothetical protein
MNGFGWRWDGIAVIDLGLMSINRSPVLTTLAQSCGISKSCLLARCRMVLAAFPAFASTAITKHTRYPGSRLQAFPGLQPVNDTLSYFVVALYGVGGIRAHQQRYGNSK